MPPKKKEAPKVDVFVEVIIILATIFFLWLVWLRLEAWFAYLGLGSVGAVWDAFIAFLIRIWPVMSVIGGVVTLAALYGVWYNLKQIRLINDEENLIYNPAPDTANEVIQQAKNPRWDKIVAQSNSTNPSDWRAAIIDADIMLDDLLQAQHYHGDGVGEMLKSVDKSDFLTLDLAWDAHKVRNQIAHDGPSFDLTERETKRVIAEFESVFREFKII